MRRSLILTLWLIAACGTRVSSEQGGGDSATVVQLIQGYDEAWARKDTTAVGQFLADNYVYFSSNGGTWSRARTMGLLGSPVYRLDTTGRSEIEVHVSGGTAVAGTRWKGTGVYGDEAINDDQRCSITLAWVTKPAAGWKIVSEHCTQIKPQA